MRLSNKITLITGASSGIGREIAKLFAEEGAKVAIADIDTTGGKAVLEEIQSSGGTAIFHQVNVAVESEVKAWVAQVVEQWGGIDIVVKQLESLNLLKRMGQSREVAEAVLFLASEKASFITATPLMVDGGYSAS